MAIQLWFNIKLCKKRRTILHSHMFSKELKEASLIWRVIPKRESYLIVSLSK